MIFFPSKNDLLSVVRFFIVGGAATVIHLGVAFCLFMSPFDINVYLVNFSAFLAAFLFSYFGHRFFTFRAHGSFCHFLMVALGGLLVNSCLLAVFLFIGFLDFFALFLSTSSAAIFTYLFSRFFVFK